MTFARTFLKTILALALILTPALAAARPSAAADSGIHAVYVNGRVMTAPNIAQMMGDSAMVKIRAVLEDGLGVGNVVWNPADNSLSIYGLPNSPVVVHAGDPVITVAGKPVQLSVAPQSHGTFMAPLDFFRTVLGARVEWVSATREIEITTAPYYSTQGFGPVPTHDARFLALAQTGNHTLLLSTATATHLPGMATALTWRSVDGGATWERAGFWLPAYTDVGIRFWADAGDGETIYAALAEHPGLWVSHDSGQIFSPVPGMEQNSLTVVAANGRTRWVALPGVTGTPTASASGATSGLRPGVYRWDAAASTWVANDPGVLVHDLTLDADGKVWAATDRGLAWADQSGGPFTFLQDGPAAAPIRQILPHAAWMWALRQDGIPIASQDHGKTWQEASFGLPADLRADRLYAGPSHEIYLSAREQGVWYSPNGGGEWFKLTGYWPEAVVYGVQPVGGNLLLATSSGGAIMPPRDAQSAPHPAATLPSHAPMTMHWGSNLLPGRVIDLALAPGNDQSGYAIVQTGDQPKLVHTKDAGQSWDALADLPMRGDVRPEPFAIELQPGQPDHVVVAAYTGPNPPYSWQVGLFRSTDGGSTWTALGGEVGGHVGMGGYRVLRSGRVLALWGGLAGSWVQYTNDDASWQRADSAPSNHMNTWATNPAQPDTVYGCDFSRCAVSHDGGATWGTLPVPSPGPAGPPWRLFWSPAAPDELYVNNYRSTDGGRTFAIVPGLSLPEQPQLLDISPVDPGHWLARATTSRGNQLWLTHHSGEAWDALSLPDGQFRVACFDRSGHLWVATSAGLWRAYVPPETTP